MKIDKKEKWLLISCLQKSIRKGFSDLAKYYATELYELDQEYLFYKLSTIAVEDIGLGNIECVSRFLTTRMNRKNILTEGGLSYVLSFVDELTNSVKDRSASDLTYLSGFYQDSMPDETKEKERIFIDDQEPIVNRLLAGWEILGSQKLKNPLVSNKADDLKKFIDLNKKIIENENILSIIENSYFVQKEPHFIAMGLLSYLLSKEKEKSMKIGNFLPGEHVDKEYVRIMVNDKWLIDGIDWHTYEGRVAIEDFCKEETKTLKYLNDVVFNKDLIPEIVGMLLFRHRGHQINKRMVYPSAIVILKMTEKMLFKKLTNNSEANFSEAMMYFEKDLELLDSIIKKKMSVPDPSFFPF